MKKKSTRAVAVVPKTAKLELMPDNKAALAKLAEKETIMRRGFASFIAAGLALKTIIDEKLYKARGFRSFSAYCLHDWGYSRSYISRLVTAALIGEAMQREAPDIPLLESHVRKLAPLVEWDPASEAVDCSEAVRVVKELAGAFGADKITARLIKESVMGQTDRPRRKKARQDPRAKIIEAMQVSVLLSSAIGQVGFSLKVLQAAETVAEGASQADKLLRTQKDLEVVLRWVKTGIKAAGKSTRGKT